MATSVQAMHGTLTIGPVAMAVMPWPHHMHTWSHYAINMASYCHHKCNTYNVKQAGWQQQMDNGSCIAYKDAQKMLICKHMTSIISTYITDLYTLEAVHNVIS